MIKFLRKINNNRAFQITKKIFNIIITIVLVLIFFVILVQKISGNRFNLGGYGVYTIASGSMVPEYDVKDLILAGSEKTNNIKIGDDVVYLGKTDSVAGKIVTHRVINIEEKDGKRYFYTKGIANEITDPVIDETQILGVVKCKLHILSICSHVINSAYGLILLIVVPFILFVFFEGKHLIDEKNKE